MRYLSICSGIEAASVAWDPLGWEPVAFAEFEAFPSAVLKHHYPHVPNWGDITKFKEWPDATIDVLVGGTPCQSFSVAGLRKGLADPRGNLALTFLAIVDRYQPRYVIWENVPGVLSSDGGGDFASFLGGLGQLGYGWCYRVLDAQYVRVDGLGRAVPQRRRRVFVVGYLGDWRRAAAVLSEPESVLGDSPPRRQAGQGASVPVAPCLRAGGNETGGDRPYGTDVDTCDSLIGVSNTLSAARGRAAANAADLETYVPDIVAHSLRADGFDASEDGTGRATPLVPVVADPICANEARTYTHEGENNFRLRNCVPSTIAFPSNMGGNVDVGSNVSPSLRLGGEGVQSIAIAFRTNQTSAQGPIHSLGVTDTLAQDHPPAIAFDTTQITSALNRSQPKPGDPCHPLAAGAHPPAVAFQPRFARNDRGAPDVVAAPLTAEAGRTGRGDSAQCVAYPDYKLPTKEEAEAALRGDTNAYWERMLREEAKALTVSEQANGFAWERDVWQTLDAQIPNDSSNIQKGVRVWVDGDPVALCEGAHGTTEMDVTTSIQSAGGKPGQGYQAIRQGWAVRRLTPTECERLQGFPDIHKSVRIEVCAAEKTEIARSAAQVSQLPKDDQSGHALVHVLINLERSVVEIHRAGRLLWSASTAEAPSPSPLSMPLDAFVPLAALMTQTAVPQIQHGEAASLLNTTSSTHRWNGSAAVKVSGRGIAALVSDAAKFTETASLCMRSTTSPSGLGSLNSVSSLETLCCCVVAAISSCIPSEILTGNSYAVIVETVVGYTAVPYRGKPAADGPRYKALGNSMAVNCMRWLGRRIQMVERIADEAA